MRNLRSLALLAPALLLPVACEDTSSPAGGAFTPEAGVSFEAGAPSEAGSPPDAGADAPPPAPKGVTLTVLDGLAPKMDVRVLAHDAAGAVIADLKTDAAGKIAQATAPAMVTVLVDYGGSTARLLTYAGVADGDNLLVNVADPFQSFPASGSFTVTFGTPFAGATDYVVRVGNCTASTTTPANPLVVPVTADCVGNQNALLAAAISGNADLAFGFVKNAAKPAAAGTVAIGPVAFTAKGTTTLKANNVPVGSSAYGDLYAIANGASFYATPTGGTLEGAGATFATATGFAEAYQSTATAQRYENLGTQANIFVQREATTAPATLDLAAVDFAKGLPAVTNAALTNATVARPDVTLTSAASLAGADFGVASLSYGFSQENDVRWTFILPPSTTAFKAPALPADVPARFVPVADAVINEVSFADASLLPGFKEAKALPASPLGAALADPSRPLPAAGTVRISRWSAGD